MEAGADLEQRADAAVDVAPRPSVGSVIRREDLSSVLLPAPLRPMMPTHLAAARPRSHVVQRPELASPLRCRAPRRRPRRRAADRLVSRLSCGRRARPAGTACRAPRPGSRRRSCSDDVREAAARCAGSRGRRRRAARAPTPPRPRSAASPGAALPRSAQRKPSTTPGHRVEVVDVPQLAGDAARRVGDRLANSQNWTRNGTT